MNPIVVIVTFTFFLTSNFREPYVASEVNLIERKVNVSEVPRTQGELEFRIRQKNIPHTDANGWFFDVLD